MRDLVVFFVQFCMLWMVWWFATNRDCKDFVFFVFGLIFATSICYFFGSLWMTRLRHLIIPLAFVAIALRWRLLKGNMGSLGKIYLLLTICVFVASFWSSDPNGFLELKWRRTVNNICLILMAATFRTGDDLRKVLYMAMPQILLLAFGLHFGAQDFGTTGEERLSVNEVNSNVVGSMAAFVVFGSLLSILYTKTPKAFKALFGVCLIVGLRALISSGSRTAFASCMCASLLAIAVVLTSVRRFWLVGVPMLSFCGIVLSHVWRNSSYSAVDRLAALATGGVSGRDKVWEMGYHYLVDNKLWFGAGGLVRGFFVDRLDFDRTRLYWGSMLNIYFDTIYETGVLGLTLWVAFLLFFFWLSFRIWRSGSSKLRYVPIAMVSWGLLQGVGESMPLTAFEPVGTFFVVGLVVISARRFQYESPTSVSRFCVASGARPW